MTTFQYVIINTFLTCILIAEHVKYAFSSSRRTKRLGLINQAATTEWPPLLAGALTARCFPQGRERIPFAFASNVFSTPILFVRTNLKPSLGMGLSRE